MEGLEEPEATDNASNVVLGSDLIQGRVIKEGSCLRFEDSTPQFGGI